MRTGKNGKCAILLIDSLQKWLKRNKSEVDKSTDDPKKKEKNWFSRKGGKENEKSDLVVCSVNLNTGVIRASLM